MADEIKPTLPQYPMISGIGGVVRSASEFMGAPFGYENPPGRILSDIIGLPGIASTMERIGYGEPLTTGKGQTTRLRPETTEAAMAVIPMASSVVKAAPAVARELAPKVGQMAEQYMMKTGASLPATMYHSSPYRFEKFSSEHIGSGEGAQVFGQGLYFTDSKGVHEFYNKQFSKMAGSPGGAKSISIGGEPIDLGLKNNYRSNRVAIHDDETNGDVVSDIKSILAYHSDKTDPIKYVRGQINKKVKELEYEVNLWKNDPNRTFSVWEMNNGPVARAKVIAAKEKALNLAKDRQEWLKANAKNVEQEFKPPMTPTAYKVDFADEQFNKMMHWDKPISEQSDKVRKAVNELLPDTNLEGLTGQDVYRTLSNKFSATGIPTKASDAMASQALLDEGIPGHKYRAAGFRSPDAKDPKHNYVVYPKAEEHLEILGTTPLEKKK